MPWRSWCRRRPGYTGPLDFFGGDGDQQEPVRSAFLELWKKVSEWLVVLSEDNWEICAREGLLGLGRDAERRFNRMADGDRVWVYVNRKYVDHQVPHVYEIRAAARIAGPVRHLDRSPWRSRGGQRFSVARPITIERRCALPARELLKSMSFAGRPPAWGMRLLNAPVCLTREDVQKLEDALSG